MGFSWHLNIVRIGFDCIIHIRCQPLNYPSSLAFVAAGLLVTVFLQRTVVGAIQCIRNAALSKCTPNILGCHPRLQQSRPPLDQGTHAWYGLSFYTNIHPAAHLKSWSRCFHQRRTFISSTPKSLQAWNWLLCCQHNFLLEYSPVVALPAHCHCTDVWPQMNDEKKKKIINVPACLHTMHSKWTKWNFFACASIMFTMITLVCIFYML